MEWMNEALCREVDPGLFVSDGQSTDVARAYQKARQVCRRCPVIDQCQDYAINLARDHQLWGVWAGMNAQDIHKLVKRAA